MKLLRRSWCEIAQEARSRGLEIAGFYHSHPDHPAQWSATDLAEAHWLGASYVITEVAQGKAAITRAWLLAGTREEDKRFAAQEIRIENALTRAAHHDLSPGMRIGEVALA